MILTKSQANSVEKLFNLFIHNNTSASFKAPTGSGKTFMASSFISKVLESSVLHGKKTIVVVATISNAELPKEFARKLNQYKKYHDFNNYEIEFISSPSASKADLKKIENIREFDIKENMVYVFGTSSFGKNTLFKKNRTLETFLESSKLQGYDILFIRDEAHIGKKEKITASELKNFDELMKANSSFTLEMTATPDNRENLVELTKEEMEEDGVYLLKSEMIKTKQKGEITNDQIIDEAIKQFIESKREYSKIEEAIIKPAMLIQIMNESDYEKDPIKNEEFHNGLNLLESKLKSAGLVYLKYLNEKEVIGSNFDPTLEYASKNDSEIDVIIFKVGPATGWDIPRANVILQLRNVSSESLNIQTLGRIMRNPFPNLEKNEITNKYYVFSNYQKPTREAAVYKLKNKFIDKEMISGKIDKSSILIEANFNEYIKRVNEFLESPEFINYLRDFSIDKVIYDELNYGTAKVVNRIPNHVKLKIFNYKKHLELEKVLNCSLFYEKLKMISEKEKINLQIVKYIFYSRSAILFEIKNETSDWFYSDDPYEIEKGKKLMSSYQLWMDNEEPKKVNISNISNYGYMQITNEEDVQYLDSTPELVFFTKFMEATSSKQKEEMSFFAKMPTLGSKVYFEYYSKIMSKIAKSYMDFAIEYNGSIIMVEVKSKDADYSEEKTNELLNAYKKYMDKFSEENLHLVLYQYDKTSDTHYLNLMMNGEWKENISFRDAFDYLLN